MARKKAKRKPEDIIMTFVYIECRRIARITSTVIECIIDRARSMGVSDDPTEVIRRIIRFAKKNARLEPEAREWIVRKFGYTKIPDEAVFATVSA